MQFAILAAGKGSRLAEEGFKVPKPLVPINGVPMIERLLSIYADCGSSKIAIIINSECDTVLEKLNALSMLYPLHICIKDTPSSMHSLYELSGVLDRGKLCLSTVDTVFDVELLKRYIDSFNEADDCDAFMAVTSYVDDEKPLYVKTDMDMNVLGYFDTPNGCHYVSAGIYCLTERCMEVLQQCIDKGLSRMRMFQKSLVDSGLKVKAFDIGKVIDVDHIDDIAKAEQLLSGTL